MTRECHVRFCEQLGGRFPGLTRQTPTHRIRYTLGLFSVSLSREDKGEPLTEAEHRHPQLAGPTDGCPDPRYRIAIFGSHVDRDGKAIARARPISSAGT